MTLRLEGWTDVSSNSIYGLILLLGYSESDILKIFDFSSESHTAGNLLLEVSNIASSSCTSWAQIKCCCTYSPRTMIQFHCLLNARYKHITVLPCTLHALNLMAKDPCKFEDVEPIVKSNCMIVNFFNSSHVWFHNSKEWIKKNGTNGKCKYSLDSLCETWWYSMNKVCLSVDAYE